MVTNGELTLKSSPDLYGAPGESNRVIQPVPAGTEIRVEHLLYEQTSERDYFYVTGSLVSGPYAGRTLQLGYSDLFKTKNLGIQSDARRDISWAVEADKLERQN